MKCMLLRITESLRRATSCIKFSICWLHGPHICIDKAHMGVHHLLAMQEGAVPLTATASLYEFRVSGTVFFVNFTWRARRARGSDARPWSPLYVALSRSVSDSVHDCHSPSAYQQYSNGSWCIRAAHWDAANVHLAMGGGTLSQHGQTLYR
jgi:hypothetical protein